MPVNAREEHWNRMGHLIAAKADISGYAVCEACGALENSEQYAGPCPESPAVLATIEKACKVVCPDCEKGKPVEGTLHVEVETEYPDGSKLKRGVYKNCASLRKAFGQDREDP